MDKTTERASCFGFGIANKATRPCPCGFYNHPEKTCICAPGVVQKHLSKISGPLLDRIDLHVEVTPVNFTALASAQSAEKSSEIRARVVKARAIQTTRFEADDQLHANAQMSPNMVRNLCVINEAGQALIKQAMEKMGLSARAYDRILKVARTIADLAERRQIELEHLAEAINYRSLDRDNWGNGVKGTFKEGRKRVAAAIMGGQDAVPNQCTCVWSVP